jgi:uncharacterized protein (PEP-CTERM system associated)
MPRLWRYFLLATCLLAGVSQATWAQEDSGGSSGNALSQRGWLLTPTLGLDLTYTDNVTLLPSGGHSDFITRLSPGFRLEGQSARARAYVDFQVQQVDYHKTSDKDRTQRALNGRGTIELADDWLFVEMSGRIARQAVSAFGTPASGIDAINSNVVESSMYQIAPYMKGKLLGSADYLLRFDNTFYSSKSGSLDDTTIQSVLGTLAGSTSFSKLDWDVNANAQKTIYSNDRTNETSAARGSLIYVLNPQLRFTAIGGRETNDYVNFTKETTDISGWGFEWAPTERTQIGWTQEKRYFGDGHSFKFNHRTANTAWRLIDTRDVAIVAPQSLTFSMGSYYDLLNEQLRLQYPDDVQRERQTLALLRVLGISPQAQVLGGFMTSRASINHTKEATFIWTGVRNVITFSAQSLDRTALGTGSGIPDDFNSSPTIKQKGVSANWSHRLTPNASLALLANKSKTSGSTSSQDTEYLLYSLMLTNRLGAYTTGSVGFRRTDANGAVGYVENAIVGSLLMAF